MAKDSEVKKEFPTLEDLMFNNKEAKKRSQKKKSFKKLHEFNKEKQDNDEHKNSEF